MRVLIVEDQPDLAATIGDFLEMHNHQVDFAGTGESALALVSGHEYDAVLLDINLPRKDGLAVCTELRQRGCSLPILMVTARDTLDDIVAGFDRGADDYLVKPFALEEMLVRLKAVSARGRRVDTGNLRVGELEIDLQKQAATRCGIALRLNALQFELLKTLALASPGVVSRETLEGLIWQDEQRQQGALRMQIHRLRGIVDEGFDQGLIETVRGYGFRLVD